MPQVGSNFEYSGRKPLDARQLCDSLEVLKANVNNILYPPGFKVFCLLEHKEYRNIAKMNEPPVWEENTQDDVIKAYMKKVDALTDMVNTLQKEVASLNEQINPPVPKGEKVTTSDGKYLVTDKQQFIVSNNIRIIILNFKFSMGMPTKPNYIFIRIYQISEIG